MSQGSAVRKALQLYYLPSQIPIARRLPLPADIIILLEINSGSERCAEIAADLEQRPTSEIREAAAFFVEQILFAPGSDSYRLLGATPDMPTNEIRRHMALLSKWVHPDVRTSREHATFAERISRAWDNLKTEDRRRAYDAQPGMRRSSSGTTQRCSHGSHVTAIRGLSAPAGTETRLANVALLPRTKSRLVQFLSIIRSIVSS